MERKSKTSAMGKKIRLYLTERGMMMSVIARKIGIKPAKLYNICSGVCQMDVVTYYKLCKALEVPFETFLEE